MLHICTVPKFAKFTSSQLGSAGPKLSDIITLELRTLKRAQLITFINFCCRVRLKIVIDVLLALLFVLGFL